MRGGLMIRDADGNDSSASMRGGGGPRIRADHGRGHPGIGEGDVGAPERRCGSPGGGLRPGEDARGDRETRPAGTRPVGPSRSRGQVAAGTAARFGQRQRTDPRVDRPDHPRDPRQGNHHRAGRTRGPGEDADVRRGHASSRVAISLKTRYHRDGRHQWTTNDIHDIDALAVAVP